VNVADSSSLYSNALTVETWIYDNDITTSKYLVSKRSAGNEWALIINGTGNLQWVAWMQAIMVFLISHQVHL